jgi:predicted ATP-dependent endonuclease of OLD family
MKIKSMYVDKFKGFDKFTLDFNEKTNAIVGLNGTGKTTILEILANGLTNLDNLKYFKSDNDFTYIDIILINDKNEELKIKIYSERTHLSTEDGGLILLEDGGYLDAENDIYRSIDGKVDNINEGFFSMLIYVPSEVNFTNYIINGPAKLEESKSKYVIINDKNVSKDFKQFLANEKVKDLNDLAHNIDNELRIEKYKKLFDSFLIDKEFIDISVESYEPIFRLKETGEELTVDQLSTGEKQTFYRGGALLQKVKDNSLILVDEPETSLHPSWEQRILDFYKNINTTSQYVFTTHSPFIVSNCKKDEVLVLQNIDGRIILNKNMSNTYGKTLENITLSIFGINGVRNPYIENILREYKELYFNREKLDKKQIVRMEKLKKELDTELDPNDPELNLIDVKQRTIELDKLIDELKGGN